MRSERLSISCRLGILHWPAEEPSVRPHWPSASALTAAIASDHVWRMQSACFRHTRPLMVSVSVTVSLVDPARVRKPDACLEAAVVARQIGHVHPGGLQLDGPARSSFDGPHAIV